MSARMVTHANTVMVAAGRLTRNRECSPQDLVRRVLHPTLSIKEMFVPAKRKIQFTVKAPPHESFPIDMLRYDACHPACNSTAVDHISASLSMRRNDKEECYPEGWTVTLISDHEPTKDRWTSFGWTVTEVRKC